MRTLRSILFIIGIFLLLFSVTMIIPIFVDGKRIIFISGFIITCLSGIVCILLGKVNKLHGISLVFMTTSCIWIVLSLFAAVPFYFNNYSYVDSLFEAVSGITTTGATIVKSIELEPRNILLWRAMLHSIGGIGIITTGIAVFPMFKNFSINSFLYSEYSDATKRNLPNIRSVVLDITMIYYGLILLCMFCYYLAGMSLFDSICHGMSTVSTGGFANYSNSIGHYNNSIFESITMTFMILGSLPFLSYLRNMKHFSV